MCEKCEYEEINIGDVAIIDQYSLKDSEFKLPKEVVITAIDDEGIYFEENNKEFYVNYDNVFFDWADYELWNKAFHN